MLHPATGRPATPIGRRLGLEPELDERNQKVRNQITILCEMEKNHMF